GLPTLNIGRDTFRKHMEVLCETHQVVRLEDALEVLGGRRRAKRDLAVITFDDGYCDVYDNAFPVLRDMKLPAVAYVPSSFVGTSNRLAHDRLWAALVAMDRRALGPMSVGVGGDYEGLLLRAFERVETPNKILERLIADNPTKVLYGLAEALEERLRIDRVEAPRGQLPMTWKVLWEMSSAGILGAWSKALTSCQLNDTFGMLALQKPVLGARPTRFGSPQSPTLQTAHG